VTGGNDDTAGAGEDGAELSPAKQSDIARCACHRRIRVAPVSSILSRWPILVQDAAAAPVPNAAFMVQRFLTGG
jgi:hypothetical protein